MSVLVIQPCPGIGDMIWALPALRGLGQALGPLTILTKSRSLAREWLIHDPLVKEVIYASPKDLPGLTLTLRSHAFTHSFVLHRSVSHAFLPFALGIPNRTGFGFGNQRYLLTKEGLANTSRCEHPIKIMSSLMAKHGIALGSQVPPLCVVIKQDILQKIFCYPKPWIVFGIGCSESNRLWPLAKFKELAGYLSQKFGGTLFLSGGPQDKKAVHTLSSIPGSVSCVHFSIQESFALMSLMDLYIGHDTGMLNVAGSFGVKSFGLFGKTRPLTYVPNIYGVVPKNHEGMGGISVHDVEKAIEKEFPDKI